MCFAILCDVLLVCILLYCDNVWCMIYHRRMCIIVAYILVERASGDDVLGCKNINYLTCKVNMWYVSGGTIAFLLLLPITIICCCCCCKKKPEPNYALSLNAMVDDQEYLISNKKKDRRNAYSTYEY